MTRVISIGRQNFAAIREKNCFLVDKSHMIREWWESEDDITLLTRPRRFGKTLNMSMLNCFFSNEYQNRSDLFEGLCIWKYEKYRKLQGTYPVIFISFASVKADNLLDAKKEIKDQIMNIYKEKRYLLEGGDLSEEEKVSFRSVSMEMGDAEAAGSLRTLCMYLERKYGKKAIVLLDEYDAPMQEAYLSGYWDELTSFIRSLFNATFKTNPYLERAIMTGVTRVSKESVFSDLNNLRVVTTTTQMYDDCFGFTGEEVFAALQEYGLEEERSNVKYWYDGFMFGNKTDIYNPWSITNFLKEKKIQSYWAATSSNGLINRLLQRSDNKVKEKMENLLQGQEIVECFDEQIVFSQLQERKSALWSLLVAGGYLKVTAVEYESVMRKAMYHLKITNMETKGIFLDMFSGWFEEKDAGYSEFIDALKKGDIPAMNHYMNCITMATFSFFDVGSSFKDNFHGAEKFYHGFVLGLVADQNIHYEIHSNRESGFGRYDVMMIPKEKNDPKYPAVLMEFKVRNTEQEKSMEDTAGKALHQIEEKEYDEELKAQGILEEHIRRYGFAFEGKRVLIRGA